MKDTTISRKKYGPLDPKSANELAWCWQAGLRHRKDFSSIVDSMEVTVPTSRSNAGRSYTPGPWTELSGGWIHAESGPIADTDPASARHRSLDERRANARLIAQAPAMAEALQALLAWADEKYAIQPIALQTLTDHARSVLAQALGE